MHFEISKLVEDYDRGHLTRRQLVARLAAATTALAGASLLGGTPAAAQQARPTFQATGVDHIALSVTDVARSRQFYERHLGLRVTRCGSSTCFLQCGEDFLALFRGDAPGLHHYSFAIDDFSADDAVQRLEGAGLTPKRRENRVYFDDPDGLEVQVSRG